MSYDYGYEVGTAVATGVGAMFGLLIFIWIVGLAVGIFLIVCNWNLTIHTVSILLFLFFLLNIISYIAILKRSAV